ncbi:MAG TPA: hypothetical protein VGI39_04900 [Polyangiaceae bacterium]|jgi:hypothetical protein
MPTRAIVIACEVCRVLFRGDPNEAASQGWHRVARADGTWRWRCLAHADDSVT